MSYEDGVEGYGLNDVLDIEEIERLGLDGQTDQIRAESDKAVPNVEFRRYDEPTEQYAISGTAFDLSSPAVEVARSVVGNNPRAIQAYISEFHDALGVDEDEVFVPEEVLETIDAYDTISAHARLAESTGVNSVTVTTTEGLREQLRRIQGDIQLNPSGQGNPPIIIFRDHYLSDLDAAENKRNNFLVPELNASEMGDYTKKSPMTLFYRPDGDFEFSGEAPDPGYDVEPVIRSVELDDRYSIRIEYSDGAAHTPDNDMTVEDAPLDIEMTDDSGLVVYAGGEAYPVGVEGEIVEQSVNNGIYEIQVET